MAGTTTNYAFNYPTSTDLVKDGATAIQTLATNVDTAMNAALSTKPALGILLNTTTVTAQNTVTISNVFTSAYENYVIDTDISATVGAGVLQFKLTASGTSSGTFTTVGWTMGVSAGTGSSTNLGTGNQGIAYHPICYLPTTGQGGFSSKVMRPQITGYTACLFGGIATDVAGGVSTYSGQAIHYVATSFDGFSLTTAGTSFTGTVRVYGLRNS
jgi:hypothetical protein